MNWNELFAEKKQNNLKDVRQLLINSKTKLNKAKLEIFLIIQNL